MEKCLISISPYNVEESNVTIDPGAVSLFDIYAGLTHLRGIVSTKLIRMAEEETGITDRAMLHLYLEESLKMAETVRSLLRT